MEFDTLILHGSVDVVDSRGNTPLIFTAMHNKRLVTSMLLWGGADRCLQNDTGNTALHEAAISGAKDVAYKKCFFKNSQKNFFLRILKKIIRTFFEKFLENSQKNIFLRILKNIFVHLLWGGADRCLQNDSGNTALHEAAISGAKDVA